MQATRATEQSQDSQRHNQNKGIQDKSLDQRYGEIGISAVAAAVRHQTQQRNADTTRFQPYDSD